MSVRKVVLVPFEQYQTLVSKVDGRAEIDKVPKVEKIGTINGTPSEGDIREAISKPDLTPAVKKENTHSEHSESPGKIILKKKKTKKKLLKKNIQNRGLSFYLPPPSVAIQSGGSKLFNFHSPIEQSTSTPKSDHSTPAKSSVTLKSENEKVNDDLKKIQDLINKHWVQ